MVAYTQSPLKFIWATLIAGLAMVTLPGAADATTPSLLWSGVRTIAIHCQVQSTTTRNAAEFERTFCSRVGVLASHRARMPVKVVEPGDPAFIRNDTVLLLVHASVERIASGHVIAFVIRPYRPSGGDAEVYFGAAPQALVVKTGLTGPALDSRIRAALSEILPAQDPAGRVTRPL